jgi:23S rRNA (uracil1939-C5)-methyltransferase
MAILVTSTPKTDEDQAVLNWYCHKLPEELPEITTAIHAVTDSEASVAIGTPEVVHGTGYITEKLFDISFQISPFSFFQTNTLQAERLFEIVFRMAGISSNSTVWDLYCGTGSISLPAARKAKKVIGIEIVESAIKDARANALRNNLNNTEFHVADMREAARKYLLHSLDAPDVVILDPPRAGLHPDVVKTLLAINAPKIVYVSCNPMTQARDCALLQEAYTVEEVHPVDMFPNTYHIESVAKLVRKTT